MFGGGGVLSSVYPLQVLWLVIDSRSMFSSSFMYDVGSWNFLNRWPSTPSLVAIVDTPDMLDEVRLSGLEGVPDGVVALPW